MRKNKNLIFLKENFAQNPKNEVGFLVWLSTVKIYAEKKIDLEYRQYVQLRARLLFYLNCLLLHWQSRGSFALLSENETMSGAKNLKWFFV